MIRKLRNQFVIWAVLASLVAAYAGPKEKELSPLDRYVADALRTDRVPPGEAGSPGSLWTPRAADLASDFSAARVDDMVTILVVERASAMAAGTTKTARTSSAKHSIPGLAGPTRAAGALANLATLSGDTQLNGDGSTSRETMLSTTLSARVTHVLPNGYLVVEGTKDVHVNSEHQTVSIRGVIRAGDIHPDNTVRSDRLAQLEIRLNGKGVVADAVRRPAFLYRLLLGLLPF
jgi:flagellar L-ring protein FlgH